MSIFPETCGLLSIAHFFQVTCGRWKKRREQALREDLRLVREKGTPVL
jgi:hypothetical protein